MVSIRHFVVALCLGLPSFAPAAKPLSSSQWMPVAVPSSMQSAPFDVARSLKIPSGFSISVHARIPGARFMAVAPNGDLLVSVPHEGKVLRMTSDKPEAVTTFASDLRAPHDLVFHTIAGVTYLYVSESHQINRYVYVPGDSAAHDRQIVVKDLPDNSTPELQGKYGHQLKNIALGPDHRLYVSIASTCNACLEDTVSNPVRGAIYRYEADGSDGRLFARGLRNAEGLAFVPGTNQLWAVVNNRDNTAYPHNDNTDLYGQVIPAYVDNHPPEEFTRVRDGGNYGWPFCNPNPDTRKGMNRMPFDRDYQFNADGHVDCARLDRISKGIPAHAAPLGLTFLSRTRFPARYRPGVTVALHGSWNRQQKSGYEVAYFPWNSFLGRPGKQESLVSGWLDETTQTVWGRPVDTAVDLQGDLLISDDHSGTIYKLRSR